MSKKSDDSEQVRTADRARKSADYAAAREITMSPPEPSLPDAFAAKPASDAFALPTEEQSKVLWSDLRELLSGLVDKAATAVDREQCDRVLDRLSLDRALGPLFLVSYRESVELEAVVKVGEGKADEAERIRREIAHYLSLSAGSPEENRRVSQEREKLTTEHTAAMRAADAASRAESGLRFLHAWLWPLFSSENPCKETTDFMGQVRRQSSGILSTCIAPPKTAAAAATLGLDVYTIDSWRALRRPEPTPARRRFRTTAISPPAGVSAMGQTPYSRF